MINAYWRKPPGILNDGNRSYWNICFFFEKENLVINIQGLVAEFPELIKHHIVEHFSQGTFT